MAMKMKNSGIDWVGEIPVDWKIAPFRSFVIERAEKNKGEKTRELLALSYALGVTLYRDKVYNMDRVKENYEDYQLVYENDLVLSPNDIIKGSVYVSKYFGCISPMYYVFTARNKNTHYLPYLSYLLRTKEAGRKYFMLARGLIGGISDSGKYITRRMTVSRQDLLSFKVPLPPFSTQQTITNFLDAKCTEIEGLLEDLNAEVKTLSDYKKSIIAETVTHGLNPNAPMKNTEIQWAAQIPQHWKVQKGKYTFTLLQRPIKEEDGVVTCFRDGEVTLRSNRREDGFTMSDKEYGYQGIEPGDLVVHGMDGFAGAIGISDSRGKGTPVLNVLDSDQNKRYLMYYLRNMAYGDVFLALSTGIRVRSCDLSWKKLGEIRIILPPIEEQKQIADYIDRKLDAIQDAINKKNQQIEKLKEYKASLIYEYVTGKKQVI